MDRFANALAGHPMKDNSVSNVFRDHFAKLKFRLIGSPEAEAEQAVERQRKLAEVFARPQQAKFRREVFAPWGARCLIKKCETLPALEATYPEERERPRSCCNASQANPLFGGLMNTWLGGELATAKTLRPIIGHFCMGLGLISSAIHS